MKDRIELVADILMGAAYTDSQLHGEEKRVIKDLLEGLISEPSLPPKLMSRIEAFSPKTFDLETTAEAFAGDTNEQKRALLQLVAAVNDADEEYDLEEDQYLRKVAFAIGLDREHFADLVLDVVEESDLEQDLEDIRFTE
ncbi:MAG: TerB family tellurite resistance protein [Deltaproteobacteria bacterium]|nr:TerB family tellurite resistance protein [Deltaproteobacteria bacterium]